MGLNIKEKNQRWQRRGIERNTEDFQKWLGVSPIVCEKVWVDLQEQGIMEPNSVKPKQFFVTIRFLKSCEFEWELGDIEGIA